jgi:hypothetical protein
MSVMCRKLLGDWTLNNTAFLSLFLQIYKDSRLVVVVVVVLVLSLSLFPPPLIARVFPGTSPELVVNPNHSDLKTVILSSLQYYFEYKTHSVFK